MLQQGDPLDDMMTPQRTQLRAASDPPNGPIGRRQPPTYTATPPPHLPLTFLSPNYHHILFKLFCWEDNWLYSHICSISVACSSRVKKSENWSLPQWWLPQGLEFLNFLYWLLQGILTLWSDLSTGGLCRPKAALSSNSLSKKWNWKFAELLLISMCILWGYILPNRPIHSWTNPFLHSVWNIWPNMNWTNFVRSLSRSKVRFKYLTKTNITGPGPDGGAVVAVQYRNFFDRNFCEFRIQNSSTIFIFRPSSVRLHNRGILPFLHFLKF